MREELFKLADYLSDAGESDSAKKIITIAEPGESRIDEEALKKSLEDAIQAGEVKESEPSHDELLKELTQMADQHGGLSAIIDLLRNRVSSKDTSVAPGFVMSVDVDEPGGKLKTQMSDDDDVPGVKMPEHQPGLFNLEEPSRRMSHAQAIEEKTLSIVKDFFRSPSLELYNSVTDGLREYLNLSQPKDHDEENAIVASRHNVFKKLADIANRLDDAQAYREANMIDAFLSKHAQDFRDTQSEANTEQSKRYDSKYHNELLVKKNKDKGKRDNDANDATTLSLSTRYCPHHVGAMLGRVGESTYQCPLDGQMYNWETGWTDHDGNQHPGGSVAEQTPDSVGYAAPHSIFDTRGDISNRK